MILLKFVVSKFLYWGLPRGLYDVFLKWFLRTREYRCFIQNSVYLKENIKYKNIHVGNRCFILATGPSIKSQDITILRNEICFVVSDFYKHKDYQCLQPAYYCLSPLHPPFTRIDGIKRFDEMAQHLHGTEILFIGLPDKEVLNASRLVYSSPQVRFVNFIKMEQYPSEIDITRSLPNVTSVAIMAVMVSMYMGFSEIYLLGCDHNNIWTWDGNSTQNQLEHFYDGTPSIGYQHQVFDIDRALISHIRVREQFKWIHQIALKSNVCVYNASPSSYINIFPKVNLGDIL